MSRNPEENGTDRREKENGGRVGEDDTERRRSDEEEEVRGDERDKDKRKDDSSGGRMDNREKRWWMKKAARTISLFPIPKVEVLKIEEELEICEKVDEDEEEGVKKDRERRALKQAVMEFVLGELAVRGTDWEQLNIKRIFVPRGDDWTTAYLEMEDLDQAEWLLGHCKNLTSRQMRVGNHIPWAAKTRHDAFQKKAKMLRDEGHRTRITIEVDDYVLEHRKKEDRFSGWEIWRGDEDTPDFLQVSGGSFQDTSPKMAKGRKLRSDWTYKNNEKRKLSEESGVKDRPANKKGRDDESTDEEEVVELTTTVDNLEVIQAGIVVTRRQSFSGGEVVVELAGEKGSEVGMNTRKKSNLKKPSTK